MKRPRKKGNWTFYKDDDLFCYDDSITSFDLEFTFTLDETLKYLKEEKQLENAALQDFEHIYNNVWSDFETNKYSTDDIGVYDTLLSMYTWEIEQQIGFKD